MNDATIRYHQVRQKSTHNSYQRTESYPAQALYWRIRSLEIDIHNSNNAAGWPQLNDNWYVYHLAVIDQVSSVNTLADALDALLAFHRAVPQHEVVTLWLDLKDDFNAARDQTPESLDRLLAERLGREHIWGPPDLIGDCTDLQAAIAAYGWPSLDTLRGKFIVGCTTGDLASPNSVLNQYVQNGATANQRLAFVTPEITQAQQIDQHACAVMFNLSAAHTALANAVFTAGFVGRAYGLNDANSWATGWNSRAHHLATNKVNADWDGWARTDLPMTGYPFTGIDVTLPPDLTESGALCAIKVDSGDIWNKRDSGYFRFDRATIGAERTLSTFVANPQSHTDGFIKGGVMARATTADDAAYIAIFQTAAHEIRMQYRRDNGAGTEKIDARLPNGVNGKPVVSSNTPIWLKLTVRADGHQAQGSYSIDGLIWHAVGEIGVSQTLPLQGWAASSHGAGSVKWLFGGAKAPTESTVFGNSATGEFIADSAPAASLGPYR
ncbi:Ca2+-dependent phosphoinositide-specific phospholipase C [Serratia bockelmannii]|uniref:Ca2+-dependent phosphoinositide-specific phospholipase C n=1 Tax=Serratia bockelmannii TaxID=2703793 RepID=UPI003FA765E3